MASNKFTAAQKELRAFTGLLKTLTELADELGEAGALERTIEAHNRAIAGLAAEEDAARARIVDLNAKAESLSQEAEVKAAAIVSDAEGIKAHASALKDEALAELAAAESKALAVVAEANTTAASVNAQTDAIIAEARAKAEAIVDVAKRRQAEIESDAKAADERRSMAERDIAGIRDQKDRLIAEIDALKARVAVV